MKAYINKGTKIKWENSPSAPEFTDERIKQAVDSYFPVSSTEPEQGQFLMWDEDHDTWGPHTPQIDDNTDVTTNNPEPGQILVYDFPGEWGNITPVLNTADDVNITSPAEGDTLVYDVTAGEWKNKAPDTWELVSTITADGTDRYLLGEIPECKSMMIESASAAGAAQLTLGLSVSFDGTTYDTIGSISGGIDTSAKYFRYFYVLNGGIWMGFTTSALTSPNATARVEMRYDSFKTGGTFTKIRFFVPANEVIPNGSEFKIYIKRK